MAYNAERLGKYRADALAGRPFRCLSCPYCNGTREAVVKHVHPSTKPASPWDFWQHVVLNKYRRAQSKAARRNAALRFPLPHVRMADEGTRGGNAEEQSSHAFPPSPSPSFSDGNNGDSSSVSEEKAFVLGPMVDQSELPFRMLCRQYGATLAYTPMLHAKSFAESAAYRSRFFTTTPAAAVRETMQRLSEAKEEEEEEGEEDGALIDRPCFVQFCGNDADTILQAARYAVRGECADPNNPAAAIRDSVSEGHHGTAEEEGEEGEERYYNCDAVDLNLGCPQGIARRGRYGSFLMEDWDLIHTVIHTLHVELEVPVTVKIRVFDRAEADAAAEGRGAVPSFGGKYYDEVLSVYYAQMVRDAGAQLLCVHGRTREMKGQLSGLANWGLIARMRTALIPREGSGCDNDGGGGDGGRCRAEGSAPRRRPSVPVLSNGNVLTFDDVVRAIAETGSEGHMCAEPLLWDPALFANPPHPVPSGRLPHGADKAARMAGLRTALHYMRWVRLHPVDFGFVKAHLFKACFHSYELHTEFREALGQVRSGGKDGEAGGSVIRGGEVAAIEEHLKALLAAEEASDVVGAQPKTAQAEKKAAKAQLVDVFEQAEEGEEEDGGLCFLF